MTGLAARGLSVRVVRTAIELTVLATGFLLGGTVGTGTLLYAVSIGPLAHVFIPLFTVTPAAAAAAAEAPAPPRPRAVPRPGASHRRQPTPAPRGRARGGRPP